ncbi:MAG: hypothetical protein ACR2P9_02380 [Gammaproteobacteria bacterium]
MTVRTLEWPFVKGTTLLLMLSALLTCALIAGSHYFQKKMLAGYESSQREFHSISNRYLSVEDEKTLIQHYLPAFIELHGTGVLGGERRLDWIEVLHKAREELGLPNLLYDIASQKPWQPEYQVVMGGYSLFASSMSLDMQLLHEADLLRLFDVLDARAGGIYTVAGCKLEPRGEILHEVPSKGGITARCKLLWYSIRPANGGEIKV